MTINPPSDFDLHSTINSHGWYDLPPFQTNEQKDELRTIISLSRTSISLTPRNTLIR